MPDDVLAHTHDNVERLRLTQHYNIQKASAERRKDAKLDRRPTYIYIYVIASAAAAAVMAANRVDEKLVASFFAALLLSRRVALRSALLATCAQLRPCQPTDWRWSAVIRAPPPGGAVVGSSDRSASVRRGEIEMEFIEYTNCTGEIICTPITTFLFARPSEDPPARLMDVSGQSFEVNTAS